ncbi:hypothetical protein [Stutzerimonas nitrititolerans]|uniref:hypothetical protein n=1 Tax=Stutzerimonas nitrititolerans TaxID=2482751 RepID=UPI0028A949E7|nr:hypothetical protein [Stutzerimonas nitrititolerans]
MNTTIQHPYEPNQTIDLDHLLDLIDGELNLIDIDEQSSRTSVGLLNDVVDRMANPAERRVLVDAICERFIGE